MINNISIKDNKFPTNSLPSNQREDPYNKIARGMEVEFLKYLLKEMRTTIDKNEESSEEVDFYTQLLDEEYSKALADKNQGVGIQNIILKQLLPKYQNQLQNQNKIASIDAYKNIQMSDGKTNK
ncbi:MAG: rod-binding protein [Oligoflexia bacterium]|nr:rod-binding protein [Oligoflexia bacterium]